MPRSIAVSTSILLALLAQTAGAPNALASPTIYGCEVAGVMTFSDRPCGAESAAWRPDVTRVSTYDAPAAAKADPSSRAAAPKRSAVRWSIAADQAKHAAECARLQSSLREIRSKLRAGYNVREGERLKVRQAKLADRRRAQRCRSGKTTIP